ncbi:hypothetical protein CCR97_08235 [Rhodoplanes elegans]|uniref:Uncharacterized protein n=1 Tax=Rhodoplanes elegans TaxID=29408 RepID=A0A327KXN3_9BRAD|nr:hypothetical protein [Rhodoplanes elegans]MBK5958199.1 hypothetical protein [Rhodoplanes elegans]RAI41982.1 hypothetical protein CH338_01375 [Rhodoplanes elegans]
MLFSTSPRSPNPATLESRVPRHRLSPISSTAGRFDIAIIAQQPNTLVLVGELLAIVPLIVLSASDEAEYS